jgi:hypothetical protein
MTNPTTAIEAIATERRRQIEVEGWTPEHDDEHDKGELAKAAACYALRTPHVIYQLRGGVAGVRGAEDWYYDRLPAWPWDGSWWKPGNDRRRQLVKAGALIVAEIERLDRAEQPQ